MGYYYGIGIGQYLFDKTLYAFWLVLKYLFKAIVYMPLLLAGYMITEIILHRIDSAVAWIGLILLFAYSFYLLLYFLKGIIIALKAVGNLLWIPLLLLCILFTCVYPAWMLFDIVYNFMEGISKDAAGTLTWIFSIALAAYIYSRYHFLTDLSPLSVYPIYKMAIETTFKMLRMTTSFKGKKAKQII